MITKERIISVVMSGVFLVTLAGAWFLPQPYSHYAGIICLTWFAAMFAYAISLKSKKSKLELLKNVVIAAVAMLYYGEPTSDEFPSPFPCPGGSRLDDGFEVTFEQRSAVGVLLFLKILLGGALGVQAAFLLRAKPEQQDKNM